MDRISEFVIFTGLLFYHWEQQIWQLIDMRIIILVAFLASIMISYSRARAEIIYQGDYDIGLMARSERLFYIFIAACIGQFFGYFSELIVLFMCLVVATALFRFFKIYSQIKAYVKRQKAKEKIKENSENL
jgi:phosphatidylglycerophosphate synthase